MRPRLHRTGRSWLGSEQRRLTSSFIVKFVLYLLVAAVAVAALGVWDADAFFRLSSFTARGVSAVAGLFSERVTQQDNRVACGPFSVEIVVECAGLFEILLFTAAILAFPAALRHKLIGLIGGAAFILGINLIRMSSLVWVGVHSRHWFELLHQYVYQISMVALVVLAWVTWLRVVVHREDNESQPLPD